MVATQVLSKGEAGRLRHAVGGLACGAHTVPLTAQNGLFVCGFAHGGSVRYQISIADGRGVCGDAAALFRHMACKHVTRLALLSLSAPFVERPRPLDLRFVKTRPGWGQWKPQGLPEEGMLSHAPEPQSSTGKKESNMSLREIPECELGDNDHGRWFYETEKAQWEQGQEHEAQVLQQDLNSLSGLVARLAALSRPQEQAEAEQIHAEVVRRITTITHQVTTTASEERAHA
jgi:hypothetical protein